MGKLRPILQVLYGPRFTNRNISPKASRLANLIGSAIIGGLWLIVVVTHPTLLNFAILGAIVVFLILSVRLDHWLDDLQWQWFGTKKTPPAGSQDEIQPMKEFEANPSAENSAKIKKLLEKEKN